MCFQLRDGGEKDFSIVPLPIEGESWVHADRKTLLCSKMLAPRGVIHRVRWAVTPRNTERENRRLVLVTYLYGDDQQPGRRDEIDIAIEVDNWRDILMDWIWWIAGLLLALTILIWRGRKMVDAIKGRGDPPKEEAPTPG